MQDGSRVQEISTRFFFLNTLSQLRQFVIEIELLSKVCNQKKLESLGKTCRYLGMFTSLNTAVKQYRINPYKWPQKQFKCETRCSCFLDTSF